MIVKIMFANRGNDDHPRQAYQLFSDVKHVEFYEAGTEGETPGVYLNFHGSDEPDRHPLTGNVYIMTDAGKTFDRFEVAPPAALEHTVFINGAQVTDSRIGGPIDAADLRDALGVSQEAQLVRVNGADYDVIGRTTGRHFVAAGDQFYTEAA